MSNNTQPRQPAVGDTLEVGDQLYYYYIESGDYEHQPQIAHITKVTKHLAITNHGDKLSRTIANPRITWYNDPNLGHNEVYTVINEETTKEFKCTNLIYEIKNNAEWLHEDDLELANAIIKTLAEFARTKNELEYIKSDPL